VANLSQEDAFDNARYGSDKGLRMSLYNGTLALMIFSERDKTSGIKIVSSA
jgi:hypothetical protein